MNPQELMKPRVKVIAEADMYEVCDQGYVRRIKTGRILKPYLNKKENGYVYVKLQVGGIQKAFHVGVLVGTYFVDNPENKPTINHDDGIKLNNHYTNIKWATYKENSQHAVQIGLIKSGSQRHDSKLTDDDVLSVRKLYSEGCPIFEIACQFRVSDTLIGKVVHNQSYKNVAV